MAQIRDLFKSQKKELYGKLGEIRIESKGFVDVARSAALLASSPSKVADAIGNQVGGALGGLANRPDDTIFKSEAPFAKPITLVALTQAQLRGAVADSKTAYFVKDNPAPNSIIKRLLDGQSPASAAALVAQQGLNKFGSAKDLKKLASALKNSNGDPDGFAPKFGRTQLGGKAMGTTKKFSEYKQIYDNITEHKKNPDLFSIDIKTEVRAGFSKGGWDGANNSINEKEVYNNTQDLEDDIKKYRGVNQVWVLFKKEGNKSVVPFAGAVTGLSENVSPEWTNFRYLGSPFKVNRYLGVERTLQFTLKLYYTTVREKDVMIKKVNYLKSLAFPYEEISEMKYGNFTQTSQYAFSPNLFYLTIGDMYKNIYGYMESLSFEIDDNTVWPSGDPNDNGSGDYTLYPSVIDVQIGMKIIENHKTETTKGGITKYKYNFDGRDDKTIEEEKLGPGVPKAINPKPIMTNIKAPTTNPFPTRR